jgi:hypothetical protein
MENTNREWEMIQTTNERDFLLDKGFFLKELKDYCSVFDFTPIRTWHLARNIFVALTRPEDENFLKSTLFFCFDEDEIKLLDESSNKYQMAREVKLLMKNGLLVLGPLSEDMSNSTRIAYFYYNQARYYDPENFGSYIKKIFTKINGDEVEWFNPVREIPFSRMDLY